MESSKDSLVEAKQNLSNALGDRYSSYLKCLRRWFQQQCTKEQFDIEARKVLGSPEFVPLHNAFLLAFFDKCSTLETNDTNVRASPQKKKARVTFDRRFIAGLARAKLTLVTKEAPQSDETFIASRERYLPDNTTLFSRISVICWECGLDSIGEGTINIVNHAIRDVLKNVVSAALSRRKPYREKPDLFYHSFGIPSGFPVSAETYQNAVKALPEKLRLAEFVEVRHHEETSRQNPPKVLYPLSSYDILEGLLSHPLPSKTVQCKTLERTQHFLHHYDNDEIAAEIDLKAKR